MIELAMVLALAVLIEVKYENTPTRVISGLSNLTVSGGRIIFQTVSAGWMS